MGKYFFKPENKNGMYITICGNMAHHMFNVLRLRIGASAILCDGRGNDYSAVLAETIDSKTLIFRIINVSTCNAEPCIPITLYQGLPKGDKMDWIIEKGIEAGVTKIIPVITSRSIAKVKETAKKTERYMRIAEAAASQSMRGIVPQVLPPMDFVDAIEYEREQELCLVAYENERDITIKKALSHLHPTRTGLWIGPEGGFAIDEVKVLQSKKNAKVVSLGPRVLRTETAALVALSQIMCIWDI